MGQIFAKRKKSDSSTAGPHQMRLLCRHWVVVFVVVVVVVVVVFVVVVVVVVDVTVICHRVKKEG